MIDIKIKSTDLDFVYRTAALIINNNKILMQRNDSIEHITLPGGKCTIGEASKEATIREIKEEIGIDTKYIKTRGIVENLFYSEYSNKNRHEILFINELQIISDIDYTKNKLENIEDKYDGKQYYEWINIDDLNNYQVKPSFILDIINSDVLMHKLIDERRAKHE